MIICSTIAMGDQLGAQLGTLAALRRIGILNDQPVVFWEELREFRRGLQFLDGFEIDDLKLLRRCTAAGRQLIGAYCRSFQKKTWQAGMKRVYGQGLIQRADGLVYHLIRRRYPDFRVLAEGKNGVMTDEHLLALDRDRHYDIRSGFGTFRDWGRNAERILGRIHFTRAVREAGDAVLAELPGGRKRVSVHFRKTDYLLLSSLNLEDGYYRRAMSFFDRENPLYVVFSDDIEACRGMGLFSDASVVFMDRHPAAVDMYLMSRMAGNIVANSSFSVWGALLNREAERVVCPRNYVGENTPEAQYINGNYYPERWIAI